MLSDTAVRTVFRRFAAARPDENAIPDKVGDDAFESLVSVVLSAQSRDEMTARAASNLFAVARTPEAILALPAARLAQLIKPCGLYNLKSRNIHRLCAALIERHDGVVPETRGELMALPGVGRKCADIMLRFVFASPTVPVDTHVHRVANRMGLAAGRTEAQTARHLEDRVPRRYAWGAHMWLLDHGKQVCRARRPRCGACQVADLCERNGVTTPA
jgi:endonuclease-3